MTNEVRTEEYKKHCAILHNAESETDENILATVVYFRSLLDPDSPTSTLVEDGLIPVLHSLLKKYYNKNEPICFQIAWALTNVACGSSWDTEALIADVTIQFCDWGWARGVYDFNVGIGPKVEWFGKFWLVIHIWQEAGKDGV